jgi:dTDP-4-dehydrorhamnose 3,5-epimerase
MIKVFDTKIKEVKLIEPNIFEDDRGYFFESYNEKEFFAKIGRVNFIQDNQSKSSYGVLRGFPFNTLTNFACSYGFF